MKLLSTILGRTEPTSVNIGRLLSESGRELEASRTRLAAAEAMLARVATLSAEEQAKAEADHGEVRRAIVRLEARIAELQKGLVEAQAAERLSELKSRAEAARRRVEIDAPKALDRYSAAARRASEAVAEIKALDDEIQAINVELRTAGLDPIDTVERRFRREPDRVIPEERVVEKRWFIPEAIHNGRGGIDRVEREVAVFQMNGQGQMVPTQAGAFEREVERVTPAKVVQGRALEALWGAVRLPPARAGEALIWPRSEG